MEAGGACSDMEGSMGSPLQSLSAPEIIMLQWLLSVLVGEGGQGLGNQENREWERNGKGGGAEMGGLRKWEAGEIGWNYAMMLNILH